MFKSFVLGLSTLVLLYFLCLSIVLGVKSIIEFVKGNLVKPPARPVNNVVAKPKPVKKAKPIKSIEINPEDFDKISFKKSS